MSKIHLHSIDSLRAIAAIVVVVGHIELFKLTSNVSNAFFNMPLGNTGVILFFVISGFLISLLLLREKEDSKKISIKKFYVRRILRIWPLYFIILGLSALIYSYWPDWLSLVLCVALLPNIPHIITGCAWSVSPQIWSIGVEEQFYLMWPVLMKYIKSKLNLILILIIVIYTVLPFIMHLFFLWTDITHSHILDIIIKFFETAKFNCMAMGGLLASLYHRNYNGLKYIRKTPFSYLFILLPFILWAFNVNLGYFTDDIMGFLFTLLIANVIHKKYFIFNNLLLNYLGKISYGIYMYHWIILVLLIKIFVPFFASNFLLTTILLYASVILVTLMVSSFSYHFIEKFFLNLKKRFEII